MKTKTAAIIALTLLLSPAAQAEDRVPVTKDAAPASTSRPLRADSGLTKAEDQLAEGKYMQALDTLEDVLERRPGDADALAYSAYAWIELGDTEKADKFLTSALQADARHLGANAYRADLFLEKGETARAVEQLQVLRLVCGSSDCAEIDRLQSKLNAKRKAE